MKSIEEENVDDLNMNMKQKKRMRAERSDIDYVRNYQEAGDIVADTASKVTVTEEGRQDESRFQRVDILAAIERAKHELNISYILLDQQVLWSKLI